MERKKMKKEKRKKKNAQTVVEKKTRETPFMWIMYECVG